MRRSMKGILKDADKDAGAVSTKGLSKPYQKRFCSVVINQGRQGKTRTQIAVHLLVSRKKLKAWEDAHPEFKEAMEIALDYARAWWENKAQRSLDKKHFQGGLLGKMMAARFPDEYSDRVVHAGDAEAPITTIRRVIVDAKGVERDIGDHLNRQRPVQRLSSDDER